MVLNLFLFDTAMKVQHKPYSLKKRRKKCRFWNEVLPWKTVNKCLLTSAEPGFYVITEIISFLEGSDL